MLRGTDELFGTVSSFVGIDLEENRRLPIHGDPPIVLLMGGRGMGKTAALGEISRAYGNRVPRVLLDLADERYGSGEDTAGPAGAPLLSLLRDLEWDLELRVGRKRQLPGPRPAWRLRFPRLSFALLAIATWQPNPELSLDEAKRVLAKAGRELSDARSGVAEDEREKRLDLVADMVSDIVSEIATVGAPFPANAFLKAGIKAVTKRMLTRSESQDALSWHADCDPGEPGDGYEALLRLARDYHRTKEFRERAEKSLVAAFLADISAGFHGWSAFSKAGNTIVLLDNVLRHETGIRFLNLVLSHRAGAGTDPLVIIAAGPGSLRAQIDLELPGGRQQSPTGWPDAYLSWQYLKDLTYDDTLSMLGKADPARTPPDLAHLVYRLTGGLPIAVGEISDAVTGKAPAGGSGVRLTPVAVSGILALPATGAKSVSGETAGTHLLRCLIPDGDLLGDLTIFAAATDLAAARSLTDSQDDRADLAQRFLLDNGWGASPHHFVGDPFLRALLLDNLSRHTTGMTADRVHAALLDRYRSPEVDPETEDRVGFEPARLYHHMALGRAPEVAAWLAGAFRDPCYSAGEWLDALRQAACAPAPACVDGDPKRLERRALALGDADVTVPDEIDRSIFRLLHAAWLLTDPLVPPDVRVIDGLASEFAFLGKKHPAGNSVLSAASRSWPKSLRAWEQQACDRPFDKE